MRLSMLGTVSLMISAIFIWIYVADSLWAIARTITA